MLLFVVFAAGFYMEVENVLNLVKLEQSPETNFTVPHYGTFTPYTYSQAVYFIMITVSTVGYGDYSPYTSFGQIVTMLILIVTIIMVPAMVTELLSLIL